MLEYLRTLSKTSDGYVVEIIFVDGRHLKHIPVKSFDDCGIAAEVESTKGNVAIRLIPWTSIVFMEIHEG